MSPQSQEGTNQADNDLRGSIRHFLASKTTTRHALVPPWQNMRRVLLRAQSGSGVEVAFTAIPASLEPLLTLTGFASSCLDVCTFPQTNRLRATMCAGAAWIRAGGCRCQDLPGASQYKRLGDGSSIGEIPWRTLDTWKWSTMASSLLGMKLCHHALRREGRRSPVEGKRLTQNCLLLGPKPEWCSL